MSESMEEQDMEAQSGSSEMEMFEAAKEAAELASEAEAAGVSDLTRAVDTEIAAMRLAQLSEVTAAAGVQDVAEGVEMLAVSSDVQTASAIVGMMSAEDLEFGLEVARTAGELWAVSDVVDLMELPVLSDFLESRGEFLQAVAVEAILKAAGTRALSQAMGATAEELEELGAQEVAEGLVRTAASSALSERSEELEAVSEELAAEGEEELEIASAVSELAEELFAEGADELDSDDSDAGESDEPADDAASQRGRSLLLLSNLTLRRFLNLRKVSRHRTFARLPQYANDHARSRALLSRLQPWLQPRGHRCKRGNYIFLLRRIKLYLDDYALSMIAYCLMPNHYHFLLRPDDDDVLSQFIQRLFNSYTQSFNRQQGRSGTLFEGRAKSVLVDTNEYIVHLCHYIHLNPITAGLTQQPGNW